MISCPDTTLERSPFPPTHPPTHPLTHPLTHPPTHSLPMNIPQTVLEKLETLPLDKQQAVLDFVEFLQSKTNGSYPPHSSSPTKSALEAAGDLVGCVKDEAEREQEEPLDKPEISFLQAAREFIGCVEGPGDLSTNSKYMDGYGQA
ncbi:DUF2281 domain-containing protein [Leptodesmis sp.]|uniref:DUF2281 domain-containing protein n=1 Tax=Leptodesmis sp. TaxID=3100501 RepID=UPI0040535070